MANTPPAKRVPKKKSNPLRAASTSTTRTLPRCGSSFPSAARSAPAGSPALSVQEQRKVAIAIKNAREVALLPYASTAR